MTEPAVIFDDRQCTLGEGPMWHPLRKQFFWFDILERRLLSIRDGKPLEWQFDEYVSAAGWVDENRLLIASQSRLFLFDLESGAQEKVVALEESNPITRSNDGRADPYGGFWIGTMGINAEEGAGAIYRLYQSELRTLFQGISISNAICFSPDRQFAYFTDTRTKIVRRQQLNAESGWPQGDAVDWLNLSEEGLAPDGAVIDSQGNFWNAQWGAARVACYSPEGQFQRSIDVSASQTTCPAFGGESKQDLLITSAKVGLPQDSENASAGKTYIAKSTISGQQEHRVII
ncbi:MAG: SMP-30/gluconolactonase/LRE family protein [Stappiaceae bacterium]